MSDIYNSIRSLVPKRSRHILHNFHSFDAKIGALVPFYQRDCVPGDNLKIYLQNLVREKPLVAPVMGSKDIYFRFFFVPYRILDDNFESGITGGDDGTVNYTFPDIISAAKASFKTGNDLYDSILCGSYTLWDYFGFGLKDSEYVLGDVLVSPIRYLWDAYYSIWNNYFRDEEIQDEVNPLELDQHVFGDTPFNPLNVNYNRDYFTSAALQQQKGTAPSFSVTGVLPVQWQQGNKVAGSLYYDFTDMETGTLGTAAFTKVDNKVRIGPDADNYVQINPPVSDSAYGSAVVDLSGAVGFDVAELRQLVQIQKILERASRTGSRYTEWLRSFFSVAPSDARLNRPEYIGGYRQQMINSEVLQTNQNATNSNTNAVGAMKGHGISAASTFIGKYFVKEYGVVMGLMYCRPKVQYTQGINRQWIKKGRYDFYLPQLCNLSEQGILNAELYWNADTSSSTNTDDQVFGYQGAWSEMRTGTSGVSGAFRSLLRYWNYGRYFASRPNLNNSFLEVRGSDWQRFYNEQSTPQLYCETDVTEDIVRPITKYPEPGRLDHDM